MGSLALLIILMFAGMTVLTPVVGLTLYIVMRPLVKARMAQRALPVVYYTYDNGETLHREHSGIEALKR